MRGGRTRDKPLVRAGVTRIAMLVLAAAVVAVVVAGAGWSAAPDIPQSQVRVDAGVPSGTASSDGRMRNNESA